VGPLGAFLCKAVRESITNYFGINLYDPVVEQRNFKWRLVEEF
jgi:hypothetical protein